MHRTRVAVLRGGLSDEYDVSLATGASVLAHIDTTRFEPIDVVITKSGEWLLDGYVRYPENVLQTVDVVFLALHGAYGEDGTIQRFLDKFSVPYTGSKALASSIAIHKALTKDILRKHGVKMAPHITVSREARGSIPRMTTKISELFGPQYFIKPVASGSSVGTHLVKNPLLLAEALTEALDTAEEVIIEPRLVGTEATCGVIERFRDEPLYALPPIEIVPPPSAEFFDNTVKYNDTTEEICPGRFSYETKREIEQVSKQVHELLNLSQYSRSDFMVTNDGIYFLEVNTLPGLTTASLFPKALAAVGEPYPSFISHLLTDALEGASS